MQRSSAAVTNRCCRHIQMQVASSDASSAHCQSYSLDEYSGTVTTIKCARHGCPRRTISRRPTAAPRSSLWPHAQPVVTSCVVDSRTCSLGWSLSPAERGSCTRASCRTPSRHKCTQWRRPCLLSPTRRRRRAFRTHRPRHHHHIHPGRRRSRRRPRRRPRHRHRRRSRCGPRCLLRPPALRRRRRAPSRCSMRSTL